MRTQRFFRFFALVVLLAIGYFTFTSIWNDQEGEGGSVHVKYVVAYADKIKKVITSALDSDPGVTSGSKNDSENNQPTTVPPVPQHSSSGGEGIKAKAFLSNKIPAEFSGSKLILTYGKLYGDTEWLAPKYTTDGTFYRLQYGGVECPSNCFFTHHKEFVEDASAVVFNFLDHRHHPDRPPVPQVKNRKDQIWVGYSFEPPVYHGKSSSDPPLDTSLNWTATYRLDADISTTYGYVEPIEVNEETHVFQMDAEKLRSKKLAAALISNCHAHSGRDTIIQLMQKHVHVDYYGRCGTRCPNEKDCRQYLANNYKFFLAFENSFCQDYVTEKFWSALDLGMVPVVYGLADYASIAPPNSYINVLNFTTIKALTDYLTYLDQNDAEYLKYLEWKSHLKVRKDVTNHFCLVCNKLWSEDGQEEKILKSFGEWWVAKRPGDEGGSWNLTTNLRGANDKVAKLIRESESSCVASNVIVEQYQKT